MKELKNHKHPVGLILILVGLTVVVPPALEPTVLAQSPVTTPNWTYTGNLNTRRSGHTSTLLPNGKVLVAGGIGGSDNDNIHSSAELYDPATGTSSDTGALSISR